MKRVDSLRTIEEPIILQEIRMTTFSEIVEAADHLSVDEQVTLLEILQRRIATRNRASSVRDVAEARREFQGGQLRPASVSDIIAEVRGAS